MSLRKTIPLYCITFLVLWLGGSVRLTESFEVIRGYHDKFLNSQCSTSDSATSGDGSACSDHSDYCTNSKKGKCDDSSDCTYCICNVNGRNTFIGNGPGSGKCVKDEDVEPESVPRDRFMIQNNNHLSCAELDTSSSRARGATCPKPFVENVPMLWKWTIGNQLMNIKTLKCIEAPKKGAQIIMKPCDLTSTKQTLSCQNCIRKPPRSCTLRTDKDLYLKLHGREKNMVSAKGDNQRWASYPNKSMPLCNTPTKYDGCYRFSDGSFLRLLNLSACQYDKNCLTQEISAPIFTHNTQCKIKWEESEYIRNEDTWKPVSGRKQFLSLVVKGNKRRMQLDGKKISSDDVLEEWNGSLLKLQIKCSGKKEPSEQHCVLLKFATLPEPQVDESTTLVPSETTQEPSIATTIKINPTSSEHGYFTDVKINPTSSEQWYFTDVKTRASSSPMLPGSKSGLGEGSSSSKAVAISVSTVALVLVLLLVFGFIVFYRRRKRMQEQRANSEEMTSRGEQNPQKVIYEEPSQLYEPLKDERGETSCEHFYEGLKATNPPEERPLGTTNDVYTYIDRDQGTASTEDEYSYARSNGIPRSFGTQLPTPAPLAGTPVYQTLEGLETEDNPSSSQNGMPNNKAPSVANNPLDQQSPNPENFYEALKATNPPEERPLGTTNDVYTYIDGDEGAVKPASIEDEYSYARSDAMPRSFGTQLPTPAPLAGTPVYQTLEGLETEEAPSVANNPLDQQPANQVYQTLEEPNAQKSDPMQVEYITIVEPEAGQNSSETLGKSSADTSADEPVYQELDNTA